ncbi:hypothetical protein [Metamycoplasma equirhinis]|uniref:hypothetical protein n=1 Tax=Metamycoplasma equirhinis TaxID=92402 RepID=UPI0035943BA9
MIETKGGNLPGFKIIDSKRAKQIFGGFAITTLISTILSFVPVAIGAVGALTGIAKIANASKGEIKTKDGFNVKWDNNESNIGYNIGFHYCF